MNLLTIFVTLIGLALASAGKMQMYKKTDGKTYERVLIPVSSTVIPLDDLPEYVVGVGFGFVTPSPGVVKPEGDIKLLTAKKSSPKKFSKKFFKKNKGGAIVEEIET